jgi:hypothetical protein
MADTWMGEADRRMKRVDLGDGTYAIAVSGYGPSASGPSAEPIPVELATGLDSDNDSITVVNPHETANWTATASATNATATATKAAALGLTHYVTMVLLSFNTASPGTAVTATIVDGVSTLGTFYVVQSAILNFSRPLKVTNGNAVSVALAAGGVGITGQVFLAGYTL